jgi:hypothetical protein
MSMTTCGACGGRLSNEAIACPHCGRPHRFRIDRLDGWMKLAAGIGAAWLLIYVIGPWLNG